MVDSGTIQKIKTCICDSINKNKGCSIEAITKAVSEAGLPTVLVNQAMNELISSNVISTTSPQNFRDIFGIRVFLHSPGKDSALSDQLYSGKLYEEYETQVFNFLIRCGDVVIDLGANVGYYSMLFGKWVGSEGRVYAFEPDPVNFFLLQKGIAFNGLSNISAYCCGVSNQTGPGVLYLSQNNMGDHRVYDCGENRQKTKIHMVSLDDFLKGIDKVNFIKSDVQGFEFSALMGARNLIKRSPNVILGVEYWPFGLKQVGCDREMFIELLKDLGFTRFYSIQEQTQKTVDVTHFLNELEFEVDDWVINLICTKGNL